MQHVCAMTPLLALRMPRDALKIFPRVRSKAAKGRGRGITSHGQHAAPQSLSLAMTGALTFTGWPRFAAHADGLHESLDGAVALCTKRQRFSVNSGEIDLLQVKGDSSATRKTVAPD